MNTIPNKPEGIPSVGDGATQCVGSDCYPATVIKVDIQKGGTGRVTVTIQSDNYQRADSNGPYTEDQTYTYTPNPNGGTTQVRWTKGGWRIGGMRGTPVYFGSRRAYQDPSF